MTLFYDAVASGNLDEVRACIGRGEDVNEPTIAENGGYDYPLNLAVSNNREDIARVLLDYGAWVNMVDDLGHQPIDYARQNGNRPLTRLLEEKQSQARPATPEKPQNQLFLRAVRAADIVRVSKLYDQVCTNKKIMIEASKILIENICTEDLALTSTSRWQPLATLFSENRYYLDHLEFQQFQYSVNPTQSWLKIGIITHLCLNGHQEIVFSFLNRMDDLEHHPVLIAGEYFLNILQLAIIYSPKKNALPLVKELIEKLNVSTQFDNKPIVSTLEIYPKNSLEPVTFCQPDESTIELFKKWNTIKNSLELAVSANLNNRELIAYLADKASDLELINATAHCLNHKTIMTRLIPTGPLNSTTKIFMSKKDADEATLEMMPELMHSRPGTLHDDIISTIKSVNKTQRPSLPTQSTLMFYLSNTTEINDQDIAYLEVGKLLLNKIQERGIHLLPDELLGKYFNDQIIAGRVHTDIDTAIRSLLSAQMIYTWIKNPTISDFGKMLYVFFYKGEKKKATPGKGNPDYEYLAAGQLLKYACMFQWSSNEIEELVTKRIYTTIIEQLSSIKVKTEARTEAKSQLRFFNSGKPLLADSSATAHSEHSTSTKHSIS